MNKPLALLFLVFINLPAIAQGLKFKKVALSDTASLTIGMQNLAKNYLL